MFDLDGAAKGRPIVAASGCNLPSRDLQNIKDKHAD
jgi:hypothetical protein